MLIQEVFHPHLGRPVLCNRGTASLEVCLQDHQFEPLEAMVFIQSLNNLGKQSSLYRLFLLSLQEYLTVGFMGHKVVQWLSRPCLWPHSYHSIFYLPQSLQQGCSRSNPTQWDQFPLHRHNPGKG